MRVLVTGDRGYIGSVLVPMMQRRGYGVVGHDVGWFDGCDFGHRWARYEQRTGDVRDIRGADLKGFDAIVHLAGLPREAVDPSIPNAMDVVDAGAISLAVTAKEAGVGRFVHLSTVNVPWRPSGAAVFSTRKVGPVLVTAEYGRAVEGQIAPLADKTFTPVFLRNAAPFGSSPRMRLDLFLNALVARALTSQTIQLTADGSATYPFVHVKDISQALILALRASPGGEGTQRFDIVSADEWERTSTVVSQVAAITGARIGLVESEGQGDGPEAGGSTPGTAGQLVGTAAQQEGAAVEQGVSVPAYSSRWRLADGIRELCRALTGTDIPGTIVDPARFDRMLWINSLAEAGNVDLSRFRLEFPYKPRVHFG